MSDRRLTPATDRIAHESLRGLLERPAYTPGRPARLTVPVTNLCRAPAGARDRQLTFGADLTVIEERSGWTFVQAAADGYCGWVESNTLGQDFSLITHRVAAPATHIYREADLKTPELMSLTLGTRLAVVATQSNFARLAQGGYVPLQHITDQPAQDPATVAESFLHSPYLWGGNSRAGLDCSGLVQASLQACAIHCPGDSDMQQDAFAEIDAPLQRNDLLFWKGHVAIALDEHTLIHATALTMSVTIASTAATLSRIESVYPGTFRGYRRPELTPQGQFP